MEEAKNSKKNDTGIAFERRRSLSPLLFKVITVMGVCFSLLELTTLSGILLLEPWVAKTIFLGIALCMVFLLFPSSKAGRNKLSIYDLIFIIMTISGSSYTVYTYEELLWRVGATPTTADVIFGGMLVIVTLEASRRAFGIVVPGLALFFLAYACFGQNLPLGPFTPPPIRLQDVISHAHSQEGIYGIPVYAMVAMIFPFLLFGAFLQEGGAGEFFVNIANALAGRLRGGAAKVAIFSSALMATISGSGMGNVAVTGSFSIPLMKRIGYSPQFAGAVEAVASTGGLLTPPVMGAGAFIMAEIIGIAYWKVALAAIIPALLYYICLYCAIDLEAVRLKLKGLPAEELPSAKAVMKDRGYLLMPLVILVFILMVLHQSLFRAALWALASVILLSMIRKATRMGPRKLVRGLSLGAQNSVGLFAICGAAGIIVGVANQTGLGYTFSAAILRLSAGSTFLTLILSAITALILGMGLPAVVSYILVVVIAAPVLIDLGLPVLAVHMFIFYFAMLHLITPPVCGAAYVGAGIAGASPMKTGATATKLALVAYVVPFIFVYDQTLLGQGELPNILYNFITATLGVAILAMGLWGVSYKGDIKWTFTSRILLVASAVGLLLPSDLLIYSIYSDIIGAGLFALALFIAPDVRRFVKVLVIPVQAAQSRLQKESKD